MTWPLRQDRERGVRVCGTSERACASACLCIRVIEGVSVKCSLYALSHLSAKVRVPYACVACVQRQPAELGEHLHTVAQAFCLNTRLLPSNASRLSRL